MSKATKRKHVTQEVLGDFITPAENQAVVKVVASKGNNLHEVETPGGEKYLVSMPTKFRKNVWIKRGNYVVVESIEEGVKVRGEIVSILYKDQIKYLRDEGKWPAEFGEKTVESSKNPMIDDDMLPPSGSDDSDGDGKANQVANPNRAPVEEISDSDSDDSEDGENVT